MCGCNLVTMKKRKSSKIGMSVITRTGRNAMVDIPAFGVNLAEGVIGFGLSNVVGARVGSLLTNNGAASSPLTTALVKVLAGVATSWAGARYAPKYANDAIALGVGMATSGGLDLAKAYLPANVKTAIGIAGFNNNLLGMPPIPAMGNRAANRNNNASGVMIGQPKGNAA